ncbi:MAG: biotin/lipoyl-containing protein [Bacteroidales bacterium]
MNIDLKMDGRDFRVEILKKDGNLIRLLINDQPVEVDVVQVERGIYSFLYRGKSYIMEVASGPRRKHYTVSHRCLNMELEIRDAETKYLESRMKKSSGPADNIISSPMPGKVVHIPVKPGDEVKEGDTLIVISAMKMESEYKAGKDAVIRKIFVKEGDTIEGRQKLIELES